MERSATSMKKKSYTRYSDAYRQEALVLADRIGVAAAAPGRVKTEKSGLTQQSSPFR